MNENINQLNENFETYQEILKNDMDYQNNNITSSNEQIKCYCGHTDYCDCGPLKEPKQERMYSEEDLREAFMAGEARWSSNGELEYEPNFNEWFEKYKKNNPI